MHKFFSIACFMLIFILSPLYGIDNIRFEHIDNKDGLSNNTVQSIMQDRRGFMWLGTPNGLNRYDGRNFSVMLPEFGVPSLPESRIRGTREDSEGRIWVNTVSGFQNFYDPGQETFIEYQKDKINRSFNRILTAKNGDIWLWGVFDGACRIRFTPNDDPVPLFINRDRIGTNIINFVYEDSHSHLWIGTDRGLVLMDNDTPSFFTPDGESYSYQCVVELSDKVYFITNNNKLIAVDLLQDLKAGVFDMNIGQLYPTVHYAASITPAVILIATKQHVFGFDILSEKMLPATDLFGIHELKNISVLTDNTGYSWFYNGSGNIWRYDERAKKFQSFTLIPAQLAPVIDSERYSVYRDSRNITWITTYGNGLFAIDENTHAMDHFTTANSALKTNYLLTVTEDRSGDIWIGTEHTGIAKITFADYNVRTLHPDGESGSEEEGIVRALFEDSNGDTWIGTRNGSIHVFDANWVKKKKISLGRGTPYAIVPDRSGRKWVGTKGGGLILLSPDGSTMEKVFTAIGDRDGLANDNIFSLLSDKEGEIWIGTFANGLQSCRWEDGKVSFRSYPFISNQQQFIRCLLQDSRGLIWVGGNAGITVFDPEKIFIDPNNPKRFYFDKENPGSLNNNIVKTIFEDSKGRIWVGTYGGGLNLAERNASGEVIFKHFSVQHGLGNSIIQSILEDNNGHLWVGTESGISKFIPESESFENYSFSEEWGGNLFTEATLRRKNGEFLSGSYNGMYQFDPLQLTHRPYNSPVWLTGFTINGVPTTPGSPDSPLKRSITETSQLTLKYKQNSFNIEFSNLNYREPGLNMYTYILENYEKAWNPATHHYIASYRNIPAGDYVFRVKGRNSSGVWFDTDTILHITVRPPFWLTWQAIALYLILIATAIFFGLRLFLKMNRLHNAVAVEKKLTEYKLRFFTNISHEFRTPLSIIRGTIEGMEADKKASPLQKKRLHTLQKSSSRLMRLIDQLLEFRKMQSDKLEFIPEWLNTHDFFSEIFDVFTETARNEKIDYTFSLPEENHSVWLDRGKVDKILWNLLSNAFKHTSAEGKINAEVSADEENGTLTLRISDSGIGIPLEKRALLFDRFRQINYTQGGIGIGLHLTAELVNIHGGTIEYKDSVYGGACFEVVLPTEYAVISEKGKGEQSESTAILQTERSGAVENQQPEKESLPDFISVSPRKYTLLVIEDDNEIRNFLHTEFSAYFNVITAVNGSEGAETAAVSQPDLIICDVMMPLMDGYEVTKKLRSDFDTSHIPIILLTAHSSDQHRMEGIEAGADDYITKPFSFTYLLVRAAKLIEQRESLRMKFTNTPGLIPVKVTTNQRDTQFMDNVNRVIEENLDNSSFSVDEFAQSLHMSRTLFYRKIKGITGYSPNEYVRVVRLKKSAELLLATDLNISEITYQVGFNDPDYFSRCFRQQMGVSPKGYREKA